LPFKAIPAARSYAGHFVGFHSDLKKPATVFYPYHRFRSARSRTIEKHQTKGKPMRLTFLLAIAILISIEASLTFAAEVLDQQNDVSPSATADSTSGGFQEQAQTFTVGVAGTLSRIAVQIIYPGFGSPGNAILTVYNTSGGLPNTSLGTASLSNTNIPSTGYAFQSFDISSYAIPVRVGDVLAYGVTSSTDSYFFVPSSFDHSTYTGGQSLDRALGPPGPWTTYSPSHDGGFQTYVLASGGLLGDFTNDGAVNAADYVLWRKHLGDASEAALNGHGNGANGVDVGDYNVWRAHFGTASGNASAPSIPVPEPNSLLFIGAAALCLPRARRR
jgi:hypothetical protein